MSAASYWLVEARTHPILGQREGAGCTCTIRVPVSPPNYIDKYYSTYYSTYYASASYFFMEQQPISISASAQHLERKQHLVKAASSCDQPMPRGRSGMVGMQIMMAGFPRILRGGESTRRLDISAKPPVSGHMASEIFAGRQCLPTRLRQPLTRHGTNIVPMWCRIRLPLSRYLL